MLAFTLALPAINNKKVAIEATVNEVDFLIVRATKTLFSILFFLVV